MGAFYTNITLKGTEQNEVAAYLAELKRAAWVLPNINGHSVLCDSEIDQQNEKVLDELARKLSARFGCPGLSVINHDDDILLLSLHCGGQLAYRYNSTPDYWNWGLTEASQVSPPKGDDVRVLCKALGAESAAETAATILTDEDCAFASDRHMALVRALGLPAWAVGLGYRDIEAGALPEGLSTSLMQKVGTA